MENYVATCKECGYGKEGFSAETTQNILRDHMIKNHIRFTHMSEMYSTIPSKAPKLYNYVCTICSQHSSHTDDDTAKSNLYWHYSLEHMNVKGSFTKSGIMIENKIYANLSEFQDELKRDRNDCGCSCNSDWW